MAAKKDIFTSSRLSKQIIVDIIDYLSTDEEDYRLKALNNLKQLAKNFNITIKPKPRELSKLQIRTDLKAFIINGSGYNKNIPDLFNSLQKK